MRTLGIRHRGRARGRLRSTPSCAPCSSPTAPGSTPRPTAPARPALRVQDPRLRFEPWRPVDILSLGKLLAFGLSTNWERELLRADMVRALGPELTVRLDPAYPAENPIATQDRLERGRASRWPSRSTRSERRSGCPSRPSGSNNWAVSGALSATGGPLIAGDPHLPPEHARDLVPGQPRRGRPLRRGAADGRAAGHLHGPEQRRRLDLHQRVADVQDLFIERIEGDRYLFEGEWLPLAE